MKQRIKFKAHPPKHYTSLGCKLLCKGIEVLEFPTPKQAKLAAERWNAKHELNDEIRKGHGAEYYI